jgi:hypothetical protein
LTHSFFTVESVWTRTTGGYSCLEGLTDFKDSVSRTNIILVEMPNPVIFESLSGSASKFGSQILKSDGSVLTVRSCDT